MAFCDHTYQLGTMIRLLNYVWTHPLNANGKLSAIARVFRWQAGSRLLPGIVALPFVEDTRLFAGRGMTGATGNWYCGLHEASEMGFVLHVLRPADIFLDVGANVGSYSVLAAGAVGASVIAVEPIPGTFDCLRSNILLNNLGDRVRCERIGLSDRTTNLRFTVGLGTVNHVLADHEELESVEVPVKTVDEVTGDAIPTLIKVDVEGHEFAVLKGAARILADRRLLAVVLETNGSGTRYGASDGALFDVMRRHEFEPYIYHPLTRILERGKGLNTIFVRDYTTVNARIQSARRYSLINGQI